MKSKVVVYIQHLTRKIFAKKKKLFAELIHYFGIEIVYKDVDHSTLVTIQSTTIIYTTESENGI